MKKPDCNACMDTTREQRISEGLYTFHFCEACESMRKYEEYLKKRRKFTPGDYINGLDELIAEVWVTFNGKTQHIEAIKSMTLRTVLNLLRNGSFRKAIRKEPHE